ncbi:MAG: hypothetical protein QOF09_1142 [Alphaproteobacteria bacterium]|jgi:hypothetical protein|nr:hypothetical protein [Alphaproteobacteria bacterium]
MKSNAICLRFAAVAFTLTTVAVAPAARAWTIDNNSGTNFDGSPKFVDPDEQVQNFGRSGTAESNSNGPHFFFGAQPSDPSRNNWSNPVTRPLRPDSFYQGNRD